jgi:DNA-binding CsgD family transcriptional regulator
VSLGALAILQGDLVAAVPRFVATLDVASPVGYWHAEGFAVLGITGAALLGGRIADGLRLDAATRRRFEVLANGMPPAFALHYQELVAAARRDADATTLAASEAAAPAGWDALVADARNCATTLLSALASSSPRRPGRPKVNGLSAREHEVLALAAEGATNPQIAAQLGISPKTVMHHTTSVYRKLGVRGRAEAVAAAYRSGLLTLSELTEPPRR